MVRVCKRAWLTVLVLGASAAFGQSQPAAVAGATARGERLVLARDDSLRQEPLATARAVTTLRAGHNLTGFERQGFWRRVEDLRGQTGWLRLSSLRSPTARPVDTGLAALSTGREASGNVVLTSGTRGVAKRQKPLTAELLLSATPNQSELSRLLQSLPDPQAALDFATAGQLQNRPLRYLSPLPASLPPQLSPEELAAGQDMAAQLLGAARPVRNFALQQYVSKIGNIVAAGAERREVPWRFVLLDSTSIVSFGLPNGMVGVTRGLFDLLDSEDDLAAVLAREIAQVQRQHWLGRSATLSVAGLARGVGSAAVLEADHDGLVLAGRAGYDTSALLTVFEDIDEAVRKGRDASLLLATTPPLPERIAAVAAQVTPDMERAAVTSAAASRIRTFKGSSP
ncbi:MAG: M48 family metalloprotease [Nevskiaceae bacterium]